MTRQGLPGLLLSPDTGESVLETCVTSKTSTGWDAQALQERVATDWDTRWPWKGGGSPKPGMGHPCYRL